MNDALRGARESLVDSLVETVAEVKPHLRGWLHLASAPLTLAAGIVLIALSPTASPNRPASLPVALEVRRWQGAARPGAGEETTARHR